MEKPMAMMVLYILCACCSVWCQTATDAKNLKTHLFTTNAYDNKIRPVVDQSKPVRVVVEFFLLAINTLDEVTETLKTTGYLLMSWHDQFMTWDAANYGGITSTFYPQDDVWKPDMALKNSHLKYEQLGDKSLYVYVTNDGLVEWYPFQVMQSTCSVDITYFPFDQQICSLTFAAWSYLKDQVQLEVNATNGIVLTDFQKNSAWEITGTRYKKFDEDIVFELILDRKPLHSLLTIVFPVILLAILNLFVFVLPSDGGEKSGYAVTVFLAFIVFLSIIESSFPENSETIAYLLIYVAIQTLQRTLITILALLMIRLASFDERNRIPAFVVALARIAKCKTIKRKKNLNRVEPEELIIERNHSGSGTQGGTDDQKVTGENYLEKSADSDVEYTWKYIVDALDILFFFLFLLTFLVTTTVCLLIAKYKL